jgi:hypothetical protein
MLAGLRESLVLKKAVPFLQSFVQPVFAKQLFYKKLAMLVQRTRGCLLQKYGSVSK